MSGIIFDPFTDASAAEQPVELGITAAGELVILLRFDGDIVAYHSID
ncbi:hypothetical protein IT072_02465 [Leifsonia sp. ZF2019]|nr:hypothetical protein [Leifsonia sp. ZF2019]UAJ79961.1 hypothetical protein IT072_02465 [Leifsonia sp. ZF2019]